MNALREGEFLIRLSTEEHARIAHRAHLEGIPETELVARLASRGAMRYPLPPTVPAAKIRRSLTEVATERALASHGRTEAVSIQTGIRPERLRELRGDTKEQNACQS